MVVDEHTCSLARWVNVLFLAWEQCLTVPSGVHLSQRLPWLVYWITAIGAFLWTAVKYLLQAPANQKPPEVVE
jgi:hypothetical protein